MARRQTQPRELVRLSPIQFSLSVSIVVILLGASGLAGYFYGLKQAARMPATEQGISQEDTGQQADRKPDPGKSGDPVTFYQALKEPRNDVPIPQPPPRPAEQKTAPVEPEPPKPKAPVPEINTVVPGGGSVVLQVASYKDPAPARNLLKELSREGYAGTVVRADLGERGTWFRVRIGPYGEADAKTILGRLREERKLRGFAVKQ